MIKERLKKNRISIMVLAAVIVAFAALSAIVAAWDEDVGDSPIVGVNEARSQLLMSGQGYSLNDKQEEEYQEKQEKLKEHIKEELTDETSAKSRIERSVAQAKENALSQDQDEVAKMSEIMKMPKITEKAINCQELEKMKGESQQIREVRKPLKIQPLLQALPMASRLAVMR